MKRKLGIAAILGIAMILLLFFLPGGMSLVITDKAGHVYYTKEVTPGDTVSLGFRHSVEKVLVVDTFVVTEDCMLYLKNTTYGSMGAGLPSDKSYNITTDRHGNFTIEDIGITYDQIGFMTLDINKYYIIVSGETCQLAGVVPHEKPLILSVERDTPIKMHINRIRTLI
ncbi:DUF1850 domain-containing protein [Methanocella arvoryzae]|uniref:DUF1850 domain-containing protein n=1 Tax=Methanocella arvoryzae (strain DSM 22066 / NBRC 105507 / MRE50) TaxID=351160 RepID=Q0W0M7_METAR|nr:DUF1850 domain-containing protein [Methanocella arvoryzae]CAJ38066.1 conserved hypothetical protein [Methanocella arvoryzae MRE50]